MTLPNFLVIGAAKGGTTSLHHYLRQHPEVYLTPVKETNFFWSEAREEGRQTVQTLAGYERLFADARAAKAIGEVSPRYLNSAGAAERIRQTLPDVRLVVSLRHPAERAWSDYLGRLRILRESRPFDEAVQPGEPCLEWGFYFPRLQRYFDRFPRGQIHVILHDDLTRDTDAVLRGFFTFLGVDARVPIDTSTRHNAAALPHSRWLNAVLWNSILVAEHAVPRRWRGSGIAAAVLEKTYRRAPKLPAGVRARLCALYRDDILATSELIGRDLTRWLT